MYGFIVRVSIVFSTSAEPKKWQCQFFLIYRLKTGIKTDDWNAIAYTQFQYKTCLLHFLCIKLSFSLCPPPLLFYFLQWYSPISLSVVFSLVCCCVKCKTDWSLPPVRHSRSTVAVEQHGCIWAGKTNISLRAAASDASALYRQLRLSAQPLLSGISLNDDEVLGLTAALTKQLQSQHVVKNTVNSFIWKE